MFKFVLFSLNLEQFKSDLMNIARTTLSSKILQGKKDHFAKLCVDAVLKLHVKFSLFFPTKKKNKDFIS
jgi:chaperonin GroEL (HSP60 family)